ncbi:MAG: hypothetical protein IJR14_09400 [Synergistaceae bacterium]|nr:hypothetical protein [Synergistaceae bacterium]
MDGHEGEIYIGLGEWRPMTDKERRIIKDRDDTPLTLTYRAVLRLLFAHDAFLARFCEGCEHSVVELDRNGRTPERVCKARWYPFVSADTRHRCVHRVLWMEIEERIERCACDVEAILDRHRQDVTDRKAWRAQFDA